MCFFFFFFFSSRRRHTRLQGDWSSDVCSSDLRAFDLVAEWLNQPAAQVVHPGTRHLAILRGLLTPIGTGGNLTSDAHLAALAIEQNAELCSCDADFGRFAGLHWRNPLL